MPTQDLRSRSSSETRLTQPFRLPRTARRIALGLTACLMAGLMMASECIAPADPVDPGGETTPPTPTMVTIQTNVGNMVIELFTEQAPQTVAKFLDLLDSQAYYDGKIFHDADASFLVAGAYSVTLEDGEEVAIVNESNNGLKNIRGRVAFYGPTDEDTAKPQFLINLGDNPDLNYTLGSSETPVFTVIGRVVEGMDVADEIAELETISGTSTDGDSLDTIPQTETGHKVRIIRMSSDEADLSENLAPIAVATAPTTVEPKATVTLDATDTTDPDGDPIAYEWVVAAESAAGLESLDLTLTIENEDQSVAEFTAPSPASPVDIVIELTVTDDRGATDTTSVRITLGDNIVPVANAGADTTAHPGDSVQLDGSGSSDADATSGTELIYDWSLTTESQQLLTTLGLPIPPAGSVANYTFTAPLVTSPIPLTIELTVRDSKGAEATDTVEVKVLPLAFDAPMSYTIGGDPTAIATGDFDDDGLPDLAIAKGSTNQVAVMLNDGEGALLAAVDYTVGSLPSSIVVADFNADERPDIATGNTNSSTLSVLLNNGDGTFAAATTFNMGFGPVSLASANFDGASGPDVAAVNTTAVGDNSLAVLTNDGQGDFNTGNSNLVFTGKVDETVITPVSARVLAAGKINSDSLADLAVAYGDRKVFILLGDSSKSEGFAYSTHFESGPTGATDPAAISLTDVSSDSNLDLVLVLNAVDKVSVRKNSGSGQFGFEALYDTGAGPSAVATGDVDGDGDVDLAVTNEDDDTVSVYQNKGTASFKAKADIELAAADVGPVGIVSADFNDDGVGDLAVVNKTSGTITILMSLTVSAEAGDDQDVLVSDVVTLHGSAKSRAGATFTYKWLQTSGTTVTLSNANVAEPTFTAPATTGRLIFQLTATDDAGATATDTVIVDVFIETASGLWYSDTVKGTGAVVLPTSTVSVLYTGKLDNRAGETFDTTEPDDQPRDFALSGLIAGWQEGLGNYDMRVGGTRTLIIPPALGYGSSTSNPEIPPNSTLWFELEVKGIQ